MRDNMVLSLEKILSKSSKNLILTADLGFNVFEGIADRFPSQFINVGICEANMIGVASGLSRQGFRVFCYTMAPFITMRCLEQIKMHMSIGQQPICLLGVGAGYAYGHQGASHHSVADFNVMKALPGIDVYSPSDPAEAYYCIENAYKENMPSYVRLSFCYGREVVLPKQITSDFCNLVKGDGRSKIGVFCLGSELIRLIDAREEASIDVYSVLSLDKAEPQKLVSTLEKYEKIITTEMNVIDGGLGDFINRALIAADLRPQVYNWCLPSSFYHFSGDEEYLLDKSGLSVPALKSRLSTVLNEEK